jgi:HEAT repeats/PBS lyase HEAT-like repeat
MKTTTRIYFRTIVLTLIITAVAAYWTLGPAMAQTREIPGYLQIHLNNVIEDAAQKGDILRIKKIDLDSIIALLDHKNHRVASSAAYALGEIRDKKAVPALIKALGNDRDHMRRIAAHALGKIGDRRAVMPLIDVLINTEQPLAVQASVITSLGRIGDPEAIYILTFMNHHPQNWLRQTTNVALQKIDANKDFKIASLK